MKLYLLFAIFAALLITGCAPGGGSTMDNYGSRADIENPDSEIPLADYLKRVPGLSVSRSQGQVKIRIRGSSTITGDNSPLYVVDGRRLGTDFARLEHSIAVSDIQSIRVLKGADAMTRYGMRAGNGAIIISTKR